MNETDRPTQTSDRDPVTIPHPATLAEAYDRTVKRQMFGPVNHEEAFCFDVYGILEEARAVALTLDGHSDDKPFAPFLKTIEDRIARFRTAKRIPSPSEEEATAKATALAPLSPPDTLDPAVAEAWFRTPLTLAEVTTAYPYLDGVGARVPMTPAREGRNVVPMNYQTHNLPTGTPLFALERSEGNTVRYLVVIAAGTFKGRIKIADAADLSLDPVKGVDEEIR